MIERIIIYTSYLLLAGLWGYYAGTNGISIKGTKYWIYFGGIALVYFGSLYILKG